MTEEEYIENIKLVLTGGILELEIPDSTLSKVLKRSLQILQRYIDSTELITVPFARCIDISNSEISSVVKVFRVEGTMGDTETGMSQSVIDPMYAQTWMAFTNGGSMYNFNDYILNYMSYNTLLQVRNTTSTDMAFRQDHSAGKLYINPAFDRPNYVTIEYVPVYKSVEQITSDYWIEVLQRLAIAETKIILGRIRTRYTSSSSLWQQDGEAMLSEGVAEEKELIDRLTSNSQIIYPID